MINAIPNTNPVHHFRTDAGATRGAMRNHASADAVVRLFEHISRASGVLLTSEERSRIARDMKFKTFHRKDFLLQEGDTCRNHWFIVKGAVRRSFISEQCRQTVLSFGTENGWVTDPESLLLKTPSKYCIETTEKTQALQLNAPQMEQLIADIPAWSDMMLQNELDQAIRTQKRINAVINMNAVERYQDMRRFHPDYEDRFSQTAIASYLGIQPETLSRLRKRWGLRSC